MPKIIFTSRYIRNPKSSNAGKLLRYMGTRESVEKVAVGVDRSPSTVRQQRLIKNILEVFPETKDYLEYSRSLQILRCDLIIRYSSPGRIGIFVDKNFSMSKAFFSLKSESSR